MILDDLNFIKDNYPVKNSQLRLYVSMAIEGKAYGHAELKMPINHVHTISEELRLSRKRIAELEKCLAAANTVVEAAKLQVYYHPTDTIEMLVNSLEALKGSE